MSNTNYVPLTSDNTKCSKNCFNATRYCCDFMIDNNINLCCLPCNKKDVKYCNKVKAKIVKICGGKIIIEGFLLKKILYTCYDKYSRLYKNYSLIKKFPFSYYINADYTKENNIYNITGCDVICSYCKLINRRNGCKNHCCINTKDIIGIVIENIS